MRALFAAALSLTVGIFLAFADEKKPAEAKQSRSEQLKSLIKKFDKEIDELKRRFTNSKDDADRAGIREEAREAAVLAAREALKLAEEDPRDATAFEAAVFVVERAGRMGAAKEVEAAMVIVAEHHLNNPKVKELVPLLGLAGQAGQKFLLAASEKATDKEVKGLALYFLGLSASEQIDEEDDDKKISELIARATAFFQKALKESPETKVGENTIAKAATEQIDSLKMIKSIGLNKALPEIEGTDLSGKKVKLSSYKGKVVLLDVWATWCGPCRAMIPHERKMVEKLKGKPFVLLSVSCDNEQDILVKFFEKEAMPWDHWFDGRGGAIAKTFRIRAYPSLFLIDHTGVLKEKWIGNPGDEKLESAVEKLVEEAVKAKG